MQLRQLNVRYDPEQDRIVLRINSIEQEEFRFFITRRYLKLLWPVLRRLIEDEFQRRNPGTTDSTAPVIAFEEEKAIRKVSFSQGFSEYTERFPLGEAPVLLTRIKVKKTPGFDILCMHPTRGRGIELPAHQEILHLFCKALRDVAAKTDWNVLLKGGTDGEDYQTPSGATLH